MAKTKLRLSADLRTLRNGSGEDVVALLAGYQQLPQVADKYGTTVKQHLLLRADLDVLPLFERVGLALTPGDLDDATRIRGPQLLVRLKAFQAMGLDLARPIDRGDTLLHRAVRDFHLDTPALLDWLLGIGVPVDARNDQGETVLHLLVGGMHDYRLGNLSLLFGATAPALFGMAMALNGMDQEAQQAISEDQRLRTVQEAWVERFIAEGLSPFDTTTDGLSVFDLVRRTPGGFDRLFERRDAGFPSRTEAERRAAEHSPDNIRLIERMEALAGRPYVCTRKENFMEGLEIEVRNADGSFTTLRAPE